MWTSRRSLRAAWSLAVALFIGSAAAALLTLAEILPPQIRVTAGPDAVVTDVAVGSHAWIAGVRPGMAASAWPGSGGTGFDIVVADISVGVPLRLPVPLAPVLALVLPMALGSWALRYLGLPGGTAVLAAASGVVLLPVLEAVGLPGAYVLAPLPVLIGLTALPASTPRLLAFAGAFVLVCGLLFVGSAIDDAPWRLVWLAPLVIGVALPLSIAALAGGRVVPRGLRVRDLVRRVTPLDQQARLSAVESERDRLASELHNSVLPELYTIMAALDTGATPEGVREHLREVDAGLRDLMMDRQTVVLRNGGLVAAAESLLEEAAPEPPVVANIAGAGRPPPAVELAAYRIVQAALDNARRHADARTIWLTVACSPDLVQIEIRDDGQGLATARASHHIGLGLMEIRARANEIGGRVTISGPPGGGWRVLFEWMA